MRKRSWLFFLPILGSALTYDVEFVGLCDSAALQALQSRSQLVLLQERPPSSLNGLRYRISADLPALIEILHAFAYYEASITYEIQSRKEAYCVLLFIQPGPQYTLSSYEVFQMPKCKEKAEIAGCGSLFHPDCLGVQLGSAALSTDIVNAELMVLTQLSRCSYPLASVEKRKVEVDMESKTVAAAACVDPGPYARFGPITFYGLKDVNPRFVENKLSWKEGDPYDADLLEVAEQRLLESDLFSSVLISHEKQLDAAGELAMKMRLSEVKHRQFSLGIFYATVDRLGGSIRWVHRNLRGMGETLNVGVDVSKRWVAGLVTYKKPDVFRYNQTFRALAQLMRENIRPTYLAFTYRFAGYLDQKYGDYGTTSAGFKIEHVTVTRSADNRTYLLAGLPLFGKYEATKGDDLDPKSGYTLVYSCTPYQSLDMGNQHFVKQRLTAMFYVPLTPNEKIVFSWKVQLGSIAGAKRTAIPLPKMFLGGSQDDLRGYRYRTVSPLNSSHQPLGGRSAIFTSLEGRIRVAKSVGIVPFADFGTVTLSQVPQFKTKWYKSVGIGIRYFSRIGPFRIDIGVPLDRRSSIDSSFNVYAAVGQAF